MKLSAKSLKEGRKQIFYEKFIPKGRKVAVVASYFKGSLEGWREIRPERNYLVLDWLPGSSAYRVIGTFSGRGFHILKRSLKDIQKIFSEKQNEIKAKAKEGVSFIRCSAPTPLTVLKNEKKENEK